MNKQIAQPCRTWEEVKDSHAAHETVKNIAVRTVRSIPRTRNVVEVARPAKQTSHIDELLSKNKVKLLEKKEKEIRKVRSCKFFIRESQN